MICINRPLIILLAAITLIGCSTVKIEKPKKYAYLAPAVQKDSTWGHTEWVNFAKQLNDKHLSELALTWGLFDENSQGVNVTWVGKQKLISIGDSSLALESLGGRHDTAYKLRKRAIGVTYWVPPLTQGNINWHEIVTFACKENGLDQDICKNKSTYAAESALFEKIFENSWDNLNPEELKNILDKSNLPMLSESDKEAMAVGTGVAARAILSASVASSGFAFYTAMSSIIYTTANLAGVTIPFVVYSTMTSTVAWLTGPYGWGIFAVTSAGILYTKLKPDVAQMTQMIISLHLIKARALDDASQ